MSESRRPTIRFVDADGFRRHAHQADVAVLCLTRGEVEAGLVGSAVERLMELTDNPELVTRYEARLLLVIEGYEDDPRELWQVPEACRFIRQVTEQWPYWTWFAMPEGGVPSLVMCLLVDTAPIRRSAGEVVGMAIDPAELDAMYERLHEACRLLCASAGLPPHRARAAIARFGA